MDESSRFPPLRIVEESTRRLFILLSNCASSKALSTAKPYIPKNNGKVERANGLIKQGTTKRHRYKTLNKWKMTCGTGLYITTFAEDIEASIIHLMKLWKSGLAKIQKLFLKYHSQSHAAWHARYPTTKLRSVRAWWDALFWWYSMAISTWHFLSLMSRKIQIASRVRSGHGGSISLERHESEGPTRE